MDFVKSFLKKVCFFEKKRAKNTRFQGSKNLFFGQILNKKQKMLRLLFGKVLHFPKKSMGRGGSGTVFVEKFLRGQSKIFADIDETGERGEGATIFDFIDVALALAERKAHIPR